jgi:hypothetical protein
MAKMWGVWCTPKKSRGVGRRPAWLRVGYGMRLEFVTKRETQEESDRRRHAFDGVLYGSAWTYYPKRLRSLKRRT